MLTTHPIFLMMISGLIIIFNEPLAKIFFWIHQKVSQSPVSERHIKPFQIVIMLYGTLLMLVNACQLRAIQ
jgi:hypothetical protein